MIPKMKTIAATTALAAMMMLGAQAASAATINLFGVTDSNNTATVDFSYDSSTSKITIDILNSSTSGPAPLITGFAFNAPTDTSLTSYVTGVSAFSASGTLDDDDWTAKLDEDSINTPDSYGLFDVAGLTGNNLNGGDPKSGIAKDATGTFVFTLSGIGLDSLTTDSFLSLFSAQEKSGNSSEQIFLARFQQTGADGEGSDVAIPGVVPLPAAGWLLLMGIGGLGVASRRRKAQKA